MDCDGLLACRHGELRRGWRWRCVAHGAAWQLLDDVGVNFRNAVGPLDERNGLIAGEEYLAVEWVD